MAQVEVSHNPRKFRRKNHSLFSATEPIRHGLSRMFSQVKSPAFEPWQAAPENKFFASRVIIVTSYGQQRLVQMAAGYTTCSTFIWSYVNEAFGRLAERLKQLAG